MNAVKFAGCVGVSLMLVSIAGCCCQNRACEQKGAALEVATTKPGPEVPGFALPAPAKELEALVFMTGRWAGVTPNGRLINREHWMMPSGQSMVGAFLQMRRTPTGEGGAIAFYEYTTIMAEPDVKDGPVVVTLYHRHMHTKLMIDEKRSNVDVFRLTASGPNTATFMPAKDIAGGIESMTYRLDGGGRLVQELAFKPGSKEKNFSTTYTREK